MMKHLRTWLEGRPVTTVSALAIATKDDKVGEQHWKYDMPSQMRVAPRQPTHEYARGTRTLVKVLAALMKHDASSPTLQPEYAVFPRVRLTFRTQCVHDTQNAKLSVLHSNTWGNNKLEMHIAHSAAQRSTPQRSTHTCL